MERVRGLWALRRRPFSPPDAPERLGREEDLTALGLSSDAGRALRHCGWRLLEPYPEVAKDLEAGYPPPDVPVSLRVYRDPRGLLVLATGRITVLFGTGVSPVEAVGRARAAELEFVEYYPWHPCALSLAVPRGRDPVAHARRISKDLGPDVLSCRPEFLAYLPPSQTTIQRSSSYADQWQWKNIGQLDGATPGADISAEEAWTLTRGKGLCVAVLDCGFRWTHKDLVGAVLEHSATVDSGTGDVGIGREKLPGDDKTDPHGTFCAAMAAARPAETDRIRGAAPEADLLLVALELWTSGERAAKALDYAAFPADYAPPGSPCEGGRGSEVISLSRKLAMLTLDSHEYVKAELGKLADKGRDGRGIPVFYAAPEIKANGSFSGDFATEHAVVTTVGMTNCADKAFRQGPNLDYVAPGSMVLTATSEDDEHARHVNGTSFAAPVAAGVAALVLSRRPELTVSELRRHLRAACEEVGTGNYVNHYDTLECYGHGRLNAASAVAFPSINLPGCLPWIRRRR
jgi:thermitase